MPTAEIIAIGTELLLGEIQDTNTRYLARFLRDVGIDLFRATLIGDNASRIALNIQEALTRSQIVITTGGLGPTVDDPTRAAIAQAFGVELDYCPELWLQIEDRFKRWNRQPTENNRRQAFIPHGAVAIENPVGTAPAFYFETDGRVVVSLPGVPREMEDLMVNAVMPYLQQHFDLTGVIKARVLHTAGIGESQVDEWIGDLETLSNPTVGLAAHPGQIDIRITAKANSLEAANQSIAAIEIDIRQRVGDAIYGADDETLEGLVAQLIQPIGVGVTVLECNLGGHLIKRLEQAKALSNSKALPDSLTLEALSASLTELVLQNDLPLGIGGSLVSDSTQPTLHLSVITPTGQRSLTRSFGGPPLNAPQWAINTTLDLLRRTLQSA